MKLIKRKKYQTQSRDKRNPTPMEEAPESCIKRAAVRQ